VIGSHLRVGAAGGHVVAYAFSTVLAHVQCDFGRWHSKPPPVVLLELPALPELPLEVLLGILSLLLLIVV
jgi:hypothetical protein